MENDLRVDYEVVYDTVNRDVRVENERTKCSLLPVWELLDIYKYTSYFNRLRMSLQ